MKGRGALFQTPCGDASGKIPGPSKWMGEGGRGPESRSVDVRPERLLGLAMCPWGAGSLLWQQGAFAGWARAAPWLRSGRVTLTRTPVCQSGPRKWASRCHGKEGAHQGRRAGQPFRVLLASARMCWKALSGQGRPPHTGQQGQAPIRSVYSKAGAGGPDQVLHPRAWAQRPSAGEPWASSHLSHLQRPRWQAWGAREGCLSLLSGRPFRTPGT